MSFDCGWTVDSPLIQTPRAVLFYHSIHKDCGGRNGTQTPKSKIIKWIPSNYTHHCMPFNLHFLPCPSSSPFLSSSSRVNTRISPQFILLPITCLFLPLYFRGVLATHLNTHFTFLKVLII